MSLSTPTKVSVPFAQSGLKDAIPASSDNINGRAGYDQGFPPINMTPRTAGGIPPFGQDMNGILYDVTLALQYLEAGGQFPYDAAFATAIGGYPAGALVSRSDLQGVWRNTVNGNTSNPETGGAGWQPEGAGATIVAMASSNVTLTPLQAARSIITITGTLTANLQLIFPAYVKQWLVVNGTSGGFSVTCKTASGTGVVVDAGKKIPVYCDGTNMDGSLGLGNAAYATIMSSFFDNTAGRLMPVGAFGLGSVDLPDEFASADAVSLSGFHFVNGANTPAGLPSLLVALTNALNNTLQLGSPQGSNDLYARASSSGVFTAWAKMFSTANVSAFIQTLFDDPDAATAQTTLNGFGYGQTWQDVTASRALGTTYTNTAGRPIQVFINIDDNGASVGVTINIGGITWTTADPGTQAFMTPSFVVPPGSTYSINGGSTLRKWLELR